jgi:putative FmdB family regulatory protein
MPIYEYECSKCGEVTDILVSGFKDPKGLKCKNCGSKGLKRIISKVNFPSSQKDRLASYDSRAKRSDSFYKDTRNIGLDAERMLKRAGVEPTEDFKAKLEKVRTDPSSVIKDHKS